MSLPPTPVPAHRATICLITPGHASSTPRLVKEADALVDAGYRVHVVAGSHHAPARRLDQSLFATAKWERTVVEYRAGLPSIIRKILRKIARPLLARGIKTLRLAARAHHSETLHLAAVAARIPADFYIGHCLAGLPAAAFAARTRGVGYGFDLEDFHETETDDAMHNPAERIAAHLLCSRLIPGCRHLTAASPLIGEECERAYGLLPITILNVFPLSESPSEPVDAGIPSETNPLSFYWFSQTIGEGRGLESVVTVLGRMRSPVELHLRGEASESYRHSLQAHATASGLKRPIIFLPSAPPSEMARLAAGMHLGLSTEASTPPNRNICLTNKIFTYLLAGVPQLMSATTAHRALAPELGEAAIVSDLAPTSALAARLDAWFADDDGRARARQTAWRLAREKFCWDVGKRPFLETIQTVIPCR